MDKSLTVGQLRAIIKNLPDELPVYATVALGKVSTWPDTDWMYYINHACFAPSGSINNEHLEVELGPSFGW